jgi:REP element-mobilizing transposase RayT
VARDERDRQRWLELLDRVATRCGWRVFAWVLMGNHFHLYLRTHQANLSAGMHDLNSGYASYFNRRHRRCGALFQGERSRGCVGRPRNTTMIAETPGCRQVPDGSNEGGGVPQR